MKKNFFIIIIINITIYLFFNFIKILIIVIKIEFFCSGFWQYYFWFFDFVELFLLKNLQF